MLIPLAIALLIVAGIIISRLGDMAKPLGTMLLVVAAVIGFGPFTTAVFGGQPKMEDFILLVVSIVLIGVSAIKFQKWLDFSKDTKSSI